MCVCVCMCVCVLGRGARDWEIDWQSNEMAVCQVVMELRVAVLQGAQLN